MSVSHSTSAQRWFAVALLVVFVYLSIQYTIKIHDPSGSRSAIMRWREQLLGLEHGDNIYDHYAYPNPPIMALLLRPLAHIEPGWAGALVWYYLKVGMALVTFFWVFRLVQGAGVPFPPWAKALTVLLSLRPIMGDLSHGNINLFILFLVVASLYSFYKGRQVGGGLLLALAIACKVTPALFVPYLVWKRAWRALAGCAVGVLLFLWAVPSCFLGWENNQLQLTSWTKQMIVPFLVHGEVTSSHENQSLPGVTVRLVTHSPSFIDYEPDPPHAPRPQRYDNLLDLSPRAGNWIVKGVELLFVGLVVWRCRQSLAPNGGWRLAAEFSVIVVGMLLFSERTWKHHCVTLMLPFAVLCYYLSACRPSLAMKRYVIVTLAVAALLMASTGSVSSERVNGSNLSQSTWESISKMAQVYGVYVWAYFLLLAALFVVLGRPEKSAVAANAEPEVVPLPRAPRSRQAG
jgi:hypothetical protein